MHVNGKRLILLVEIAAEASSDKKNATSIVGATVERFLHDYVRVRLDAPLYTARIRVHLIAKTLLSSTGRRSSLVKRNCNQRGIGHVSLLGVNMHGVHGCGVYGDRSCRRPKGNR